MASSLEITPAETVPETDTGGQVENTKALERTVLKELGKLRRAIIVNVCLKKEVQNFRNYHVI